MQKHIKT